MGLRTMLQKHPKTGVYYFRKRYPLDVVGDVGRAEYKRSLNTKIRKEADIRVVEAERDFNQQIVTLRNVSLIPQEDMATLRNILEGLNFIKSGAPITIETVRNARVDIYERIRGLAGLIDDSVEQYPLPASSRIYTDMFEEILSELPDYERMFEQPGFSPSQAKQTIWARISDYKDALREALHQPVVVELPKPAPVKSGNKKTLQYAYDAWKSVRNPSIQSATEWGRAVRLFTEFHGDIALQQITKQHVKEFREAIRKVPTRLKRTQLKATLPELVKLASAGKLDGEPRTAGAVNKLVVALSAMFDVMCDEDVMKENPAKGLLLKAEDSNRLPYTIEDLNTLFHSQMYATRFTSDNLRPSRFWLPLMALYTGGRVGELSQARVEDIIIKGEVAYLSINTQHEGKRLKTKSSRRDVPIHQQLINFGLLDYVARAKKSGAVQLFPDLTLTKHGAYAASFSNWYGRYCRDIGLNDPNKVFHSFRHNFKDACRDSEIPKDVHDRLTGHASPDVGSSYGLGYSVEKLNQYVQRIAYEGLHLQHLCVR